MDNLLVVFMLAGDASTHVKRASRIKVDGHGGLKLYHDTGEGVETIEFNTVRSIRLAQMQQTLPEPVAAFHG